jgi:3D (Asp-Asp-Asp) domain-containing protein
LRRLGLMAAAVLSLSLAAIPISSAHSNYHYHAKAHHVDPTKVQWKSARVSATAYVVRKDTGCETYTARTSNGSRARVGTIAVDPKVFPIGTRFKLHGHYLGTAEDTGGAIRGHSIDIAVLRCHDAWLFGRRQIIVQYLLPMKEVNVSTQA